MMKKYFSIEKNSNDENYSLMIYEDENKKGKRLAFYVGEENSVPFFMPLDCFPSKGQAYSFSKDMHLARNIF